MTKEKEYIDIMVSLPALLEGVNDNVANLANTSALLYDLMRDVSWVGFYMLKNGELVLGPFQGKVACTKIAIGKGVCGTCAITGETQVVGDVSVHPNHIACDPASRSEIVVPIRIKGKFIGVLDIDAPITNRFDETDKEKLETIVNILKDYLE
ncbi:MAG: GAF domain-containing protein [Bacilli bacterium]|nr:GAF domain-containing protein [Bacilli bacterium]